MRAHFAALVVVAMRLSVASAIDVEPELGTLHDSTSNAEDDLTTIDFVADMEDGMSLDAEQLLQTQAREVLQSTSDTRTKLRTALGVPKVTGDLGEATSNAPNATLGPTAAPTAEEGCEDRLELLNSCKESLVTTQTFLGKVEESALEALPKPEEQAPALLGESQAAHGEIAALLGESQAAHDEIVRQSLGESAQKASYCPATLTLLKECHVALYRVTAFVEHVGAGVDGQVRPGYPGSKIPPPGRMNTSHVVHNATTDPKYELTHSNIVQIEKVCNLIQAQEIQEDTESYETDQSKQQNVQSKIAVLLGDRASFFLATHPWQDAAPAAGELPKCKGCWLRRRRATASSHGEVNSCPPIPTQTPTAAPTPTTAPTNSNATETPQAPSETDATPPKTEAAPAPNITGTPARPDGPDEQPQAIDGSPDKVEGYRTPVAYQGKWFAGALSYAGKGAWSCNTEYTATCSATGDLACETKGPGSNVAACKSKCDACDSCAGFNFVQIPYMENEKAGGLCVYLNKGSVAKAPAKSCEAFDSTAEGGKKCQDSESDQDFYCCSTGAYYEKEAPDEKPVCLECCTATDASKCDGPQCEDCTPHVASCDGAPTCCTQTPPCDDPKCEVCPVQEQADDQVLESNGKKYHLKQPAGVPWTLEGYNTTTAQGVFYMGALDYEGNGKAKCKTGTVGSADAGSCIAPVGNSKLQDCKTFCDNDVKCVGFNVVYNKWNIPGSAGPWMRDAPNDGGTCIFFAAGDKSQLAQKKCYDWEGDESLCLQPGTDKDWFCCRAAYFYDKTPKSVLTALKHPNGTVTVTEVKPDGTTTVTSDHPQQSAPVCHAKEGDGKDRPCIFPFMYEGKEYAHCTSNGNPQPWCFTDVTKGYWGVCSLKDCKVDPEPETVCQAKEADGKSRPCILPFVYKGVQKDTCISDGHHKPWCFTDITKGYWGECESGCATDSKESSSVLEIVDSSGGSGDSDVFFSL